MTGLAWQVFISADPRVEAARAALQQCDWDAELDRKLQVVRNTFRSAPHMSRPARLLDDAVGQVLSCLAFYTLNPTP